MFDWLSANLVQLLRLPDEPDPPLGEPSSMRVFRAAPGFLRYRLFGWGMKQLGAVAGLLLGVAFLSGFEFGFKLLDKPAELLRLWGGWSWIKLFETMAIIGFLLQLLPSWLAVRLDYRYRWYMITDRSLRIREGLWRTEERTMTFSNIQNVEVRQGPLQRLFGIADLRVQTAGGAGEEKASESHSDNDPLHIGRFRGVANAEEIRDAILAQLRQTRDSGLGDPDEATAPATRAPRSLAAPQLEAARELLRQSQLLSRTLTKCGDEMR